MAFAIITIGIVIFFLGYVTPVSGIYTLPFSLFMLVYGVTRLLKNGAKNNGTSSQEQ